MIGVMRFLSDVSQARAPFDFVDEARCARARASVERGIEVILKTQIRIDGTLTAWCAQYDEVTFDPRGARAYEHSSISGQESVGIALFLMQRRRPDARTTGAVYAAVSWLRSVRIEGIRLERRAAPFTARWSCRL